MSLIPLGFWAASGGGAGVPAFDLLETEVLTSSASSVTFTGLDTLAAGYQHLQIRAVVRSDWANTSDTLRPQLNGDTGNSYARHYLTGRGTDVISGAQTSKEYFSRPTITAGTSTANQFTAMVFDILDFSSSSKNSTARVLSGHPSDTPRISLDSGVWLNTNAVTSIYFQPDTGANFVTGSRFSIYGVK